MVKDWTLLRIQDFATTSSGGTPSRSNPKYYTGDIRWVTTGELKDCYIFDTNEHITEDAIKNSSAKIFPAGTLLVAMYGATIGKLGIIANDASTNQACCAIMPDMNAETKYLYYWFLHNRQRIVEMGCGAGQPNISQNVIKNLEIELPPIEEQNQIAEALSDIDNLIENTEKLIEKKKAIKQGVMQELLTGKRRLPGFSGEWRECTLDQIGSFRKGASISRDESQTGDIPAVRYGELYTVHNDYIKEYTSHISQDVAEKSVKVKKNDILFTASGETKEDIGKCAAIVDDFTVYAGGDLIIFTPSIEISPVYFGTRLNHSDASKYKSLNGQGDSVVHISATVLGKMLISYPIDIKEQEAISSVIYDMDKEIETLAEQLQKYKNIKTGVMSKLLTGEIRLVE